MSSTPRFRQDVLALQRFHGLTRAEARVATRLAEGMTVAEIARDLDVGIETIRSHLKQAFAKTGSGRQAELVRVVLLGSHRPASRSRG
jgi:DNA-binding CsgD family transcriptional regulator